MAGGKSGGTVVVACNDDECYPQLRTEGGCGIVKESDGIGIGHTAVINIPCTEDSLYPLPTDQVIELLQKISLAFFIAFRAHRHTEVPV